MATKSKSKKLSPKKKTMLKKAPVKSGASMSSNGKKITFPFAPTKLKLIRPVPSDIEIAQAGKLKPNAVGQRAKNRGRHQQDIVPALAQRQRQPHAGQEVEREVEPGHGRRQQLLRLRLSSRSGGGHHDLRLGGDLREPPGHGGSGDHLACGDGVQPDPAAGRWGREARRRRPRGRWARIVLRRAVSRGSRSSEGG